MFGKKKKSQKESQSEQDLNQEETPDESIDVDQKSIDESILGVDETQEPEDDSSEKNNEKQKQLQSLKDKISRILQANNIEIIDENEGDEFEGDSGNLSNNEKQQQDYDSLKALFGKGDKAKKQELTLTIDDFDYTYTGKYVDEYDLMHLKSIKKVRIQHKMPKALKGVLIGLAAAIVVTVGVVLAVTMTKEKPITITSVALSVDSQNYFVDQTFDYRGLYFNVTYSDGTVKKVNLNSSYFISSIGSGGIVENGNVTFSASGDLVLTFGYGGFYDTINVNVENKEISGISAIFQKGLFNIEIGSYITEDLLQLIINYSNTDDEWYNIFDQDNKSNVTITVDGLNCSYDSSINGYKVSNGTTTKSTIIISYNSSSSGETFKLTITYTEGETFASYN